MPEVSFDDGQKAAKTGEVVISDEAFKEKQQPASQPEQSTVQTSFDDFGNRVETRYFSNQSNLDRIVLKTYMDGHKEAVAYARNGASRNLPKEMLERALTVNPGEIMESAGISDSVREDARAQVSRQNIQPNNNIPAVTMEKLKEEAEKSTPPKKPAETPAVAPTNQKSAEQKVDAAGAKPQTEQNAPAKSTDQPASRKPKEKSGE